MGHCTIAPQPLLHRNHLPRKKVELSTEKLWVHKNTKPWPPRLSVKAQRRERPPSTSACWEWEWKKKKKKRLEVGCACVVYVCECLRGGGGARDTVGGIYYPGICRWTVVEEEKDRVPRVKAKRRPPKKRRRPRNSCSARDCIRAQFVFIHPCFVAFDFREPKRVQLCPYNFLRRSRARLVNPFLRWNQWHCSSEWCLNTSFLSALKKIIAVLHFFSLPIGLLWSCKLFLCLSVFSRSTYSRQWFTFKIQVIQIQISSSSDSHFKFLKRPRGYYCCNCCSNRTSPNIVSELYFPHELSPCACAVSETGATERIDSRCLPLLNKIRMLPGLIVPSKFITVLETFNALWRTCLKAEYFSVNLSCMRAMPR